MIGFLWFFLRSVKVTFRRGDTLHPDVFTMCRVLPLHAFRLCTLRFGIGLELDSVWNWIRIGFGPWRSADTRNLFLSFPSVSFSFSEPLFPGFFLGFFLRFFPGFFPGFFLGFWAIAFGVALRVSCLMVCGVFPWHAVWGSPSAWDSFRDSCNRFLQGSLSLSHFNFIF